MHAIRLALVGLVALLTSFAFGQLGNTPWPKFHNNNLNTGISKNGGSNGLYRWKWIGGVGTNLDSGVALASDGTAYVVSNDNNLYAIKPDGTKKWATQLFDSLGTPTIAADGTIYVGTRIGVFSVSPTGSINWEYALSTDFQSSPVILSDGSIAICGVDGKLRILNNTGTLRWSMALTSDSIGNIAVASDGTMYVPSSTGALYAVSPTQQINWTFTAQGPIQSSPCVGSDGTIYFGCDDYNLYAVDSNGKKKWTYKVGDSVESSPAIAPDGSIVFGCTDNYIYCLNPSGSLKWKYKAYEMVGAPAIGADGTVYIGASDDNLYAINPDGSRQWIYSTGLNINTSPAIGSDGAIYVNAGNTLFAIGTEVNTVSATSLSLKPATVTGGNASTATITLDQNAPSGGDVVALLSSSSVVTVPPFVIVPSGSSSATFTVSTQAVLSTITATITATSGSKNDTAVLAVVPPSVSSVSVSPTSVTGGASSTGTVTLTGPAQVGGDQVLLSSSDTNATVPTSVVIPAGSSTGTFTITTVPVKAAVTASIIASIGTSSASTTLTINPPKLSSLSLSPKAVVGGNPSTATITLTGPAPSGGYVVATSSVNPNATTPGLVTIPEGATSTTFTVNTDGVPQVIITEIDVVYSTQTVGDTLTINLTSLKGLAVSPNIVTGGTSSTGTVTLDGMASIMGLVVNLSSDNVAATVPAHFTIPPNAKSGTFTITTQPVATSTIANISSSLGTATIATTLTVQPPGVKSVTLSPSTIEGAMKSTGTVTLTGPAPSPGIDVVLTSDNAAATVPVSVLAAGGATTVPFTATGSPVSVTTKATITAKIGSSSQSAVLTIAPPIIVGLSFSPSVVEGTQGSTGTITLSSPAANGGFVIKLTSSDSHAVPPSSVTVPSGASQATFTVSTSSVTSLTIAYITAAAYGSTIQTSLGLVPVKVSSLSLNPASVEGGVSSTGTLTLDNPAPAGGITASLWTNSRAATAPASITIPAGSTTGTFSVTTTPVSSTIGVVIQATYGGSVSATLTITQPKVKSVTIAPVEVVGGASAGCLVTIDNPAPVGGVVLALTSDSASAALPAQLTVPSGSTTATCTITTSVVNSITTANISASSGGASAQAPLTIDPPGVASVSVSPVSTLGGYPVTGTVNLNVSAPSGGMTVSLSSSSTSAPVPGSVTVPAGSNTATFVITTIPVDASIVATITASTGSLSKTCTLTIGPPYLGPCSLSTGHVVGGSPTVVTGTVRLYSPAGPSGAKVSLTSSNPSAASGPATVVIPAGSQTATYSITTYRVTTSTQVAFTASFNGSTATNTLGVDPYTVSISLNPTTVNGGSTSDCTVTLNGPSPSSGMVVSLGSSSSSAKVPSSVKVASGGSSTSFSVSTTPVLSTTTALIQAWLGSKPSSPSSATLTIASPVILDTLFVPDGVTAGSSTTLYVVFSSPVPSRSSLAVSSSSTRLKVGNSLLMVGNQSVQAFKLPTTKGPATQVAVTVSFGGSTGTATLNITS
ncbi:MAG: PQQ-binding-like beta-propeller repeat protein [Fimbriimonas sp.]|nr:PQQ-binding-like beta-propeller repeat protein [Fimbriimonas sp.]